MRRRFHSSSPSPRISSPASNRSRPTSVRSMGSTVSRPRLLGLLRLPGRQLPVVAQLTQEHPASAEQGDQSANNGADRALQKAGHPGRVLQLNQGRGPTTRPMSCLTSTFARVQPSRTPSLRGRRWPESRSMSRSTERGRGRLPKLVTPSLRAPSMDLPQRGQIVPSAVCQRSRISRLNGPHAGIARATEYKRGQRRMSAQRCWRLVIGSTWKSASVFTRSSKSVVPSRR